MGPKVKVMRIKMIFDEEVLGSSPANTEIYADYIGSKAPDAKKMSEEIEAVGAEGVLERMATVFPHDEDDNPFVWDYMIKGMLKDSCGFLRKIPGTACSKLKAYKKEIDGLIFPGPRRILFHPAEGKKYVVLGDCQRPLRASTPQGERNALAMSETVPAGSFLLLDVAVLRPEGEDIVKECFDYGRVHGFGQWRNSGKGRFHWELLEEREITLPEFYESFPIAGEH